MISKDNFLKGKYINRNCKLSYKGKGRIKSIREAGFSYVTWQVKNNNYLMILPMYYELIHVPSFTLSIFPHPMKSVSDKQSHTMKMLTSCSARELKIESNNGTKTGVLLNMKKKISVNKKTIHTLYSKRTLRKQFIITWKNLLSANL